MYAWLRNGTRLNLGPEEWARRDRCIAGPCKHARACWKPGLSLQNPSAFPMGIAAGAAGTIVSTIIRMQQRELLPTRRHLVMSPAAGKQQHRVGRGK